MSNKLTENFDVHNMNLSFAELIEIVGYFTPTLMFTQGMGILRDEYAKEINESYDVTLVSRKTDTGFAIGTPTMHDHFDLSITFDSNSYLGVVHIKHTMTDVNGKKMDVELQPLVALDKNGAIESMTINQISPNLKKYIELWKTFELTKN